MSQPITVSDSCFIRLTTTNSLMCGFVLFFFSTVDIQTVRWLTEVLQGVECIVVLVSHDRSFLDAVCTDIIEFKSQQLVYFPGGYEDFITNKEEMAARTNNMVDAQARKEGE